MTSSVPLNYNDGSPIEASKLLKVQKALVAKFPSLTFFPQPNDGIWTFEEVTYRDEIVIYRIVTTRIRFARAFLRQFKETLKRELRQEEIFIVERDVRIL